MVHTLPTSPTSRRRCLLISFLLVIVGILHVRVLVSKSASFHPDRMPPLFAIRQMRRTVGQVLLLGLAFMLGVICSSFGQFASLGKVLLEMQSQTDAAGVTIATSSWQQKHAQQLRGNKRLILSLIMTTTTTLTRWI